VGRRLLSVGTHVVLGLYAGVFAYVHVVPSLVIVALFLLYEYVEETKIRDEMYYEVREFVLGYAIGLFIGMLVFKQA
jgi:hypothetical protein